MTWNVCLARWLLLAVTLLITACQDAVQTAPPTIRIGHAPHDHHAPLYIAAMNPDYFKEHGGLYLKEVRFREEYLLIENDVVIAQVMISASTGGANIIKRLVENQLDISYGGVPAMLASIDQRQSIHIVAPVMAEGAGMVVKSEMPVHNWDEFIAYARTRKTPIRIGHQSTGSVQGIIFERALEESGISHGNELTDSSVKVQILNMNGAKNLLPAMDNGVLDGFVVMQPFLAQAEAMGKGRVIAHLKDMPLAGRGRRHPCCALAASDSFLKTHQREGRKLLTLLERARKLLRDNPARSAQQVAKWLGNDVEVERRSLPTIDFEVSLDKEWNEGISFWINEMMAVGELNDTVRDAQRKGRVAQLIYDRDTYNAISGSSE